ncbi:hypothetical protein K7X08_025203 [Anisodus acutangulus]|uniref:Uncharacterized protein n=1 Tax=Anisodus acutangulus TaxID=402998 RepID=A0A9Q1RFS0_9SOLA|nr:hypothetical protein K7X08_025203 [Anisodus acutangulus]
MATASQYSQIAEAQLSGPEGSTTVKAADFGRLADGNSPGLSGITVDKFVEFTYEELATVTNDFSIANKIGQSGLVRFTLLSSEERFELFLNLS